MSMHSIPHELVGDVSFPDLLRQYMDEGLCGDPSRAPAEQRWNVTTLATELVRLSRDRHRRGYVETVKRNVRDWRVGRKSCQQKWLVLLCAVFFASGDDPRKRKLEKAQQDFDRARRDPTRRLDFGIQVTDPKILRLVYDFDEKAYIVDKDEIVQDIPWPLFRAWWEAYRPGFLCAFKRELPIAVLGLFPITEQYHEDFMAGKVSEFDLTPEIIREASRPGAPRLWWYLSGLSWKGNRGIKKYLPRLIAKSMCQWIRNNARYIEHRNIQIVSEGATPSGEALLNKRFGFELVSSQMNNSEKPRFNLVTNVEEIMYALGRYDFFAADVTIQHAAAAIRTHVRTVLGEPLRPSL
jgi:hypothetical protein